MTTWGKTTSYRYAIDNGWYEECSAHMPVLQVSTGYWNNEEKCKETAAKCNTIYEWSQKFRMAYNAAKENGWFEECCKLLKDPYNRWTQENCINLCKKCSSKSEFKKHSSAYKAACKNGWIEECYKQAGFPPKGIFIYVNNVPQKPSF